MPKPKLIAIPLTDKEVSRLIYWGQTQPIDHFKPDALTEHMILHEKLYTAYAKMYPNARKEQP